MGRRARIRRLREEDMDEPLEEVAAPAPAPAKAETPAARALELQRSAGNRAVGAALQRWPMWFPGATAQWPKAPQVIVDGRVLELMSFSWADSGPGTGIGTGGGPGKARVQAVNISTRPGTYSAELAAGTARGQHYKTVTIVMPKAGSGYTITLKDVLLSSYQASGDTDTWTVDFAAYEMGTSPPPAP